MEEIVEPSRRPPSLELFLLFLRLGATAFGGMAIIEYFRRFAVKRKGWLDDESFNYGIAISQAIPGPPTAKVAAYVGLRARGVSGAIIVLTAYILPTFVLMLVFSYFYSREQDLKIIATIFNGLQVIILAIVVDAIFTFGKSFTRSLREILIALIAAALFMVPLHPIYVILISAAVGMLIYNRLPFAGLADKALKMNISRSTIAALVLLPLAGFLLLYFFDRPLFALSAVMFRVGFFSFGGGFGAIPLLLHEVVIKYHWMTEKTLMDGIALGTITPGPIIITATFIGFRVASWAGAFAATVAVFYPTLLFMVVTMPYFDRLTGSKYFNKAIGGILCSFLGMFLWVVYSFASKISWDWKHALLAAAAFLAMRLKIEIVLVVLAGVGISLWLFG